MSDHVLTCRIYFIDAGNAENAFNHIKALAEHSAAHDRQVGGVSDPSWARLHECFVSEDEGATTRCATSNSFILEGPPAPGEIREWAPGQDYVIDDLCSYQGVTYRMIQPTHTTQAGWEPPNVASIWEAT